MITRPPQSHLAIRSELETALKHAIEEAEGIAGAAARIAHAAEETLAEGGTVAVQPQLQYLTGAMIRLAKDLGVVEHLQKHGAAAQKRALLRKA